MHTEIAVKIDFNTCSKVSLIILFVEVFHWITFQLFVFINGTVPFLYPLLIVIPHLKRMIYPYYRK